MGNAKKKIPERILEDSKQNLEDAQSQRKLSLKIFSVFYLIGKNKAFSPLFRYVYLSLNKGNRGSFTKSGRGLGTLGTDRRW